MRGGTGLIALTLAALTAMPVAAQVVRPAAVRPPTPAVFGDYGAMSMRTPPITTRQVATRSPWYAPLASLILPGTGQLILNEQRGVGYLVVDGYLLLQASAAQKDGTRAKSSYRRMAADVARAQFGGTRPDGNWTYYEVMEQFLESGQFRVETQTGMMPETDESTYNGTQWKLARETYWNDPENPPPVESQEFQRALAFYDGRAIRDEYRWSWRDAQLQQDVYRQEISISNRSYKRAINLVGAVAANHLFSMVDAYLTVRVRRFAGSPPGDRETGFNSGLTLVEVPGGTVLVPGFALALPIPRSGRR